MIIHKVKFQNFKSYTQETLIDFDKVKGVWEISGPVGAGKSSICEAIIYTLYGKVKGKSYKDLITWGQKHGYTEIWITSRGKEIHIKRELNAYGQSPVYIWIDGQEKTFSDKRNIQQELLDNYIEIPQMMMEEMYMISFDNFKPITSMSAKDLRGFLNNVLGLSAIDDKINKIKGFSSDINQQIGNESSIISELQSQKNIPIHAKTNHSKEISELRKQINDLKQQEDRIRDKYTPQLNDLQEQIESSQSNMSQITILGKAKRKEINLIKGGVCPTCGAKIDGSVLATAEKDISTLMEAWKTANTLVTKLSAEKNKIKTEVQQKISKVQTQQSDLITKINQYQIEDAKNEVPPEFIADIEARIKVHQKSKETLEIKKDKIDQLLDVFYDTVYPKLINYIIAPINKSMNDMCAIMGLSYIPQLDNTFHCIINRDNIDNTPVSSLSTGQRKTIDIIMILSIMLNISSGYNYNLIWLDELFSNFDTDSRHRMISMIKSILDKDKTCVIISHQPIQGTLKDGDIKLTNDREGTKISFIRYEQ